MARMLELIREGKAPTSIVRRAARGELSVPPSEAIAILSILIADGELRDEAEQTLQRWDEPSLREFASDEATAPEVLRCLLRTQEQRPAVIEALCENPALAVEELETAASHGGAAALRAILGSARVRNSNRLLRLIEENPAADAVRAQLTQCLGEKQDEGDTPASEAEPDSPANIEGVSIYAAGNMQELLMRYCDGLPVPTEEEHPFELVKGAEDEADPLADLLERATQDETPEDPQDDPEEKEQLSLLQRIARMRVGERIKLAMKGTREERMILIRDRSKLVSLAVLASPKVNETEMEGFAAMKNIQEAVLRAIATNRKNLKNYGVIKALVNNPKAPLDVSLPLIVHLLIKDLRAVSISKNVNDTLRKRALRLFRLKTEPKQG